MQTLVNSIIEDGKVDAQEVEQLKTEFLADGVIDREEADALFAINDAVSGNDNDPSYNDFFVEAISSHVLEDEDSPGVVDTEEGAWLASKIEGDGTIDELEKALLANISTKATRIDSEPLNALIEAL